jgi:broad specificity phosphatase PhoE
MSQLILIRHSLPERDTTIPAAQWRLSHQGRERCRALAEQLKPYNLTLLISSGEPKAVETARLAGGQLGIASQIAAGLHEHDRSNLGFLPERGRFEALVQEFFEKPGEKVFGAETADQTHGRFLAAVETLVQTHLDEKLGIVAHGAVIALLASRANGLDAFAFWQRLGMPGFVVVEPPHFEMVEMVNEVG